MLWIALCSKALLKQVHQTGRPPGLAVLDTLCTFVIKLQTFLGHGWATLCFPPRKVRRHDVRASGAAAPRVQGSWSTCVNQIHHDWKRGARPARHPFKNLQKLGMPSDALHQELVPKPSHIGKGHSSSPFREQPRISKDRGHKVKLHARKGLQNRDFRTEACAQMISKRKLV